MEKVRIRDGKKSDPGSGINIPDPQHWYVYTYHRTTKEVASGGVIKVHDALFISFVSPYNLRSIEFW
jgi:hypothetical protein